jgi:hypothetical protein
MRLLIIVCHAAPVGAATSATALSCIHPLLLKPIHLTVVLACSCSAVATSFSAFGIFDGHGGKPAATYASKELLPIVMRLVDRCIEGNSSSSNSFSRQASAAAAAVDAVDGDAAGDEAWGIEVTEEDRAVWAAQEALVDRLPKVRARMCSAV